LITTGFQKPLGEAFTSLQQIHENIYTGNISVITPLHPGDFIVALHTGSNKIVIGEGMYAILRYTGVYVLLTSRWL
jgi:hypothetical protein